MRYLVLPVISILLLIAYISAFAQSAHVQPDLELGQKVATRGTSGGMPACASCHGTNGEADEQGGSARLAGQLPGYLAKELNDYANGSRKHPFMTPMAQAMSQRERSAVAAYYAAQSAPPYQPGVKPTAALIQRGRDIAEHGDKRLGVQACVSCHGPNGRGMPPAVPYIAGQKAIYLTATLNEWKSKRRRNDPTMHMPYVADHLSGDDIKAVVAYFEQLPPPKPAGRP